MMGAVAPGPEPAAHGDAVDRQRRRFDSFMRSWIRPRPLLLGIVAGFLGCCLAGYLCSRVNPYKNFQRFHIYLSPESQHYPTASQFLALARGPADPAEHQCITVVIGGHSVMQGTGQGKSTVWHLELQRLLGPRYRVVNLAMRGGSATEGAAIAAEALQQEGRRVILVTSVNPMGCPAVDGMNNYYQFWDAYHKRLIQMDAPRIAKAMELHEYREKELHQTDRLLGERLDSWLYFNDLWTTVQCRFVSTVWTKDTVRHPWRRRNRWPDPEVWVPPLEMRISEPQVAEFKRKFAQAAWTDVLERSPNGQWRINQASTSYQQFRTGGPLLVGDAMKRHTIVVIPHNSPAYVSRLPADQIARYKEVCNLSQRELAAMGYTSLVSGGDYDAEEFSDWIHLSPSGGRRLAAEIAPLVQRMAKELNYLP